MKTNESKADVQLPWGTRAEIEGATVRFKAKGGYGIFLWGGLVITSAQNISGQIQDSNSGEKDVLEIVQTPFGEINLKVLAVDPVSDIAALSSQIIDSLPDDTDAFDKFYSKIAQIDVYTKPLKTVTPAFLLTQSKTWIAGQVFQFDRNSNDLLFKFFDPIEPVTSGSPIVSTSGELFGVFSNTSVINGKSIDNHLVSFSKIARPHLSLPVWVADLFIPYAPKTRRKNKD